MNVFPTSIPDLDIRLDTPEWFEWLARQDRFRYIGNLTEMSVKKRPNGMWYARKKISSSNGSKPIDLYIGSDEECTSEKLKEINYHFGKDNSEFWRWYYSPDRRGDKSKGVQPKQMYTSASPTAQTQTEITQLRAEVERLNKRESYLLDQLGIVKAGIIHEAQQENEQLKKQNAELDNANWECEKKLTIYSEMHRKSELKRQELQTQIDKANQAIADLKTTCKRINLDCKVYKLHTHEVVRLEDLTKLGYELQRSLA